MEYVRFHYCINNKWTSTLPIKVYSKYGIDEKIRELESLVNTTVWCIKTNKQPFLNALHQMIAHEC